MEVYPPPPFPPLLTAIKWERVIPFEFGQCLPLKQLLYKGKQLPQQPGKEEEKEERRNQLVPAPAFLRPHQALAE